MRFFRRFLLSLLVASLAYGGESLREAKAPRFAMSTDGTPFPLWVSSSLAIADGELRPDLFDPAFLRMLEGNEARNPERCVSYLSLGPLHVPEGATIEDRVGLSYSVVTGSISFAEQGFFRGTPGTAYTLNVSERPKVLGHDSTAEVLYIFVSSADIPTGSGHICSVPLPGTPVPQIGDRVVVFARMPAQDEDRQFLVVNGKSHIIVERGAGLIGRTEAKTMKVRDLSDVLSAIQKSDGLRAIPARRQQ